MRTYRTTLTGRLAAGDQPEPARVEAASWAILDALIGLGVRDPEVGGTLSVGVIEVEMLVDADGPAHAAVLAQELMTEALTTAGLAPTRNQPGGGRQYWSDLKVQVQVLNTWGLR